MGALVANLLEAQTMAGISQTAAVAVGELLTYVLNNLERMRYGSFLAAGYWIGSGAVEAAHRTLVQHRLKRSGQRWTIEGAQQVVNLRAARMSGQWQHVQRLVQAT